jgi:hypothetical protein
MKTSLVAAGFGAGLCLAAIGLGGSAAATPVANRAWVSGHGVDQAGCGAPVAPCRSLQYAHDSIVIAGGEIDILDPAGYGSVTITKAISIVNDGVGTAGVQASSGNAITINAGPGDAVYLKGLNIDGIHASASNGVQLNTAGTLTIINCVARHFANAGILLSPTTSTQMNVVDSVMTDDGLGLSYSVTGTGFLDTLVIEHAFAADDDIGFRVNGAGAGEVDANISDSHADNNQSFGVELQQAGAYSMSVGLDNIHADDNLKDGVAVSGALVANLNRSVVRANALWGVESSQLTAGAVVSYGNNLIHNNGIGDIDGSALTQVALQ